MNASNLGTENPMTDKEIMVERVAKAIYLNYAGDGARWDCVDPHYQETVWRNHARAAIASMPHSEQVENAVAAVPAGWGGAYHFSENRQHHSVKLGRSYPTNLNAYGEGSSCAEAFARAVEDVDKALTRNVSDKE